MCKATAWICFDWSGHVWNKVLNLSTIFNKKQMTEQLLLMREIFSLKKRKLKNNNVGLEIFERIWEDLFWVVQKANPEIMGGSYWRIFPTLCESTFVFKKNKPKQIRVKIKAVNWDNTEEHPSIPFPVISSPQSSLSLSLSLSVSLSLSHTHTHTRTCTVFQICFTLHIFSIDLSLPTVFY